MLGAILGGGGALLGALRGNAQAKQEQQQEDSSRQLAAETARYSPWTGMTPGAIKFKQNTPFGSVLGGALQGGMAGAQMGMGMPGGEAAGAGNIWEQMGKKPPTMYGAGGQTEQASLLNRYSNPTV